jgi:hypothetical protein
MTVVVKQQYEDAAVRVPGDSVEEVDNQLLVKNGEKITGRFPLNKVEYWWMEAD